MTQADALKTMLSGANVFLTGSPGAGKTFVLNQFIEQAIEQERRVAITASTGIAASHINGTTIHSWSGLGIKDELTLDDLEKLKANRRVRRRLVRADVLVIDEVSMLHGHRLDMVNRLAKSMRRDQRPFGGLQVILCGDLFQLPPVTRGSVEFDFCHKSAAWRELGMKICYITEQHRQADDDGLLDLLEAMRQGKVTEYHRTLLHNREITGSGDHLKNLTRLYSHNVDVDAINQDELEKLPSKSKTFRMESAGDPYKVETLKRNVLAPEKLELKEGAEVMFVANDFQIGFVNGTRGRVIKFRNGIPVVQLHDGGKITVEPHSWSIKDEEGEIEAEVSQMPLRLAWAITIHKSQGMSLDAAEVDLSKAFTPGMGYVALSRVRSLDGLYLQGFSEMALKMHEEIYTLDVELKRMSEGL